MVHHIPSSPLSQQPKSKEKPQLWKMTCLRPAPPSRSSLNQNEATPGSSNKRNSISAKPSARKGNFTHYFRGYLVKKSSLLLASFGLFGHRQGMTEAEQKRPIPKFFGNRPSASATEVFW